VPPPAAAATASAVAAPALGAWGMCMADVLMVTPGCATVTPTVAAVMTAAVMAAVAPAHKLGAFASGEVVLVACVERWGFWHRADMCSRHRTHYVCMRADSGSGLLKLMCGHDRECGCDDTGSASNRGHSNNCAV
jgi:hypothetical protein